MDDGHENRRNKGISYNSNDHEIKTVVFIKGLREKRQHSIEYPGQFTSSFSTYYTV